MEANENQKKGLGERLGLLVGQYKEFFAARGSFARASKFQSMNGENVARYWRERRKSDVLGRRALRATAQTFQTLFGTGPQ